MKQKRLGTHVNGLRNMPSKTELILKFILINIMMTKKGRWQKRGKKKKNKYGVDIICALIGRVGDRERERGGRGS